MCIIQRNLVTELRSERQVVWFQKRAEKLHCGTLKITKNSELRPTDAVIDLVMSIRVALKNILRISTKPWASRRTSERQ